MRGMIRVIAFFFSMAIAGPALTARPSLLDLQNMTWTATHIAVVSEDGVIDGKVTLMRTLFGDFGVNSSIEIPELAQYADESRRMVSGYPDGVRRANPVTGLTMIVFLVLAEVDGKQIWTGARKWPSDGPRAERHLGHSISTLWVERDEVFSFDHGRSRIELIKHEESYDDVMAIVNLLVAAKSVMSTPSSTDTPGEIRERINRIYGFIDRPNDQSSMFLAHKGICALGNCGPSAFATLAKIHADSRFMHLVGVTIPSLGKTNHESAGPYLHNLLEQNYEWWKTQAEYLPMGWMDSSHLPAPLPSKETLLYQWNEVVACVKALTRMKDPRAQQVVSGLTELFESTPAIADSRGWRFETSRGFFSKYVQPTGDGSGGAEEHIQEALNETSLEQELAPTMINEGAEAYPVLPIHKAANKTASEALTGQFEETMPTALTVTPDEEIGWLVYVMVCGAIILAGYAAVRWRQRYSK